MGRRSSFLGSPRTTRGGAFSLPLRTSLVGSDGRVATFSRPSKARYEDENGIIREVAEGQPRLRADRGVLIEEARTNRLVWSADLSNAAWVKTNCTVERVADPNAIGGFVNRITATAPGASVSQALAGLASAARIGSWRVRRVSGSGEVTIGSGAGTSPLTLSAAFADVSLARAAATEYALSINLAASGDVIDVEVGQVEEGTFRTSWIVTAGTPLARAADVLSVSTAGWPVGAGRIAIRFRPTTAAYARERWLVGDSSIAGAPDLYVRAGNQLALRATGAVITAGDVLLWESGVEYRVEALFEGQAVRLRRDGALVAVRLDSPGVESWPTSVYIGSDGLAGINAYVNGWIADLEVSP